jgi:hypothetical protein
MAWTMWSIAGMVELVEEEREEMMMEVASP